MQPPDELSTGTSPAARLAEEVETIRISHPHELSDRLRQSLIDCWIEVSNAGGAVGFPFPPVDADEVGAAADRLAAGLAPMRSRLLVATVAGALAGWLNMRRDPHPLIAHWGTLHHVQTRPAVRGRGIGVILMQRARDVARHDMRLEQQLHLAARGGVGLEEFYRGLGWTEIGRRPGALRLAPGDDRDEVLMHLSPL